MTGLLPGLLPALDGAEQSDRPRVVFTVVGTPAPKGSGRAMVIGGQPRFLASSSSANQVALQSWDVAVRQAASRAVATTGAAGLPFVGLPLRLRVEFFVRRPGGHWRRDGRVKPSAPLYPAIRPDLSKLVRALEDSLTGIVYDDDCRIVQLYAFKEWAMAGGEGAHVVVEPAQFAGGA